MPKKAILILVSFLFAGALVFLAGVAADSSVGMLQRIQPDSPCPATACASGECHGFDDVPEPDGVHEMACPEAGCASAECHAWETLIGRYRQASDASLNLWIVAPVALAVGLVLIAKKAR